MNSELLSYYPNFEANQVLTNTHLNELRQYLDEQIRLSRSQLTGIGIACGFTFILDSAAGEIILNEGFGITSEGYMIQISGEEARLIDDGGVMVPDEFGSRLNRYVKYRDYTDPSSDFYWYDGIKGETYTQESPMYLLLTEQEADQEVILGVVEDSSDHTDLPTAPDFYLNKVLVIYLEQSDISLKSCIGNDCDNKGQKRYLTPRVLLVDKDAMGAIEGVNCGYHIESVDLNGKLVRIPEPDPLLVPRLIKGLSPQNLTDLREPSDIIDGYVNALAGYNDAILDALELAHSQFAPFLGLTENQLNLITDRPDFTSGANIQVGYAFLRDLTKAYNEFVELAYYLKKDCCREDYVFCRHLMLGLVNPNDQAAAPVNGYRNYFVRSAISPDQDRKIYAAQLMWQRIILMIQGFEEFDNSGFAGVVELQPSKEPIGPLSGVAIPDYLDQGGTVDDLYKVWSSELALKGREDWVISFVTSRYSAQQEAITPLDYGLDWADFFRTQNLLGLPYLDVMNAFRDRIENNNLPFSVVAIGMGDDFAMTAYEFNAYFGCLEPDYQQARISVLTAVGKLEELVSEIDPALFTGIDMGTYDPIGTANSAITACRITLTPDTLCEFAFLEAEDNGVPMGVRWGEAFYGGWQSLMEAVSLIICVTQYRREQQLNRVVSESEMITHRKNLAGLNDVLSLLEEIATSSGGHEVTALYYHLFGLLDQFSTKNPRLFHNFAAAHPGMEHMDGVPAGGTLVLVYESNIAEDGDPISIPSEFPVGIQSSGSGITFYDISGVNRNQPIVADFCLPYNCCETFPQIVAGKMENGDLPPFAGIDTISVGPGGTVVFDVLLDDFDPGTGIITNKEFITIENVSVFQPAASFGVATAYPTSGPLNLQKKSIEYTAPGGIGAPTTVGIRYEVSNSETGLSTPGILWVMVRRKPLLPIEARPEFVTGNDSDRILIDVLDNDLYEFVDETGATTTATLTFLNNSTSDISTNFSRPLEIISIGAFRLVAYYPGQIGTDSFDYKISYPSGETSTTYVVVEVTPGCCCEDLEVEVDAFEKKAINVKEGFEEKGIIDVKLEDNLGNQTTSITTPDYEIFVTSGGDLIFQSSAQFSGDLIIPYIVNFHDGKMRCQGKLLIRVNPVKERIYYTEENQQILMDDLLDTTDSINGYKLAFFIGNRVNNSLSYQTPLGEGTFVIDSGRKNLRFDPSFGFVGEVRVDIAELDSTDDPLGLTNVRVIVTCCTTTGSGPEMRVATPEEEYCPDTKTLTPENRIQLTPAPDDNAKVEALSGKSVVSDAITQSGKSYYFTPGATSKPMKGAYKIRYTMGGKTASTGVTVTEGVDSSFSATPAGKSSIKENILTQGIDLTASSGEKMKSETWNFGDGSRDRVLNETPENYAYNFGVMPVLTKRFVFAEDMEKTLVRTVQSEDGCTSTSTETVNFSETLVGVQPAEYPQLLGMYTDAMMREHANITGGEEYAAVQNLLKGLASPKVAISPNLVNGIRERNAKVISNEANMAEEFSAVLTAVGNRLRGRITAAQAQPWMILYGAVVHAYIRTVIKMGDFPKGGKMEEVSNLMISHIRLMASRPYFTSNNPIEQSITLNGTLNYSRSAPNLASRMMMLRKTVALRRRG